MKMKNLKKVVCLLLTFAMLVAVFSACNNGSSTKVALSSEIDDDGRFIWSVVRPAECATEIDSASKSIRSSIKSAFDAKVTILKDSAAKADSETMEILIGDTNREESAAARQALIDNRPQNGRDFIVRVVGNKIVINGLNDNMVATASSWFEETFCQSADTWNLLYDGYEYIYQPEFTTADLLVNGNDLGAFKVVYPRFMTYIYGQYVEQYLHFVEKLGYTPFSGDERDDETNLEILVGNTTRSASKDVEVEGDNYVLKVVGNKLVIKGGSELATYRAMQYFVETVKEAVSSNKGINWSDGYVVNGKYDPAEAGTYTLNFNEEFESSALNLNIWSDYGGRDPATTVYDSCLNGKIYHLGSSGKTAYEGTVPKLVYNSDGVLHLGAKRVSDVDFLTTELSTYYTHVFRYGIMETRVKLAPVPATTSIWCNGGVPTYTETLHKNLAGSANTMFRSAMTETDIIENFGRLNFAAANVHRWWNDVKADGNNYGSNGHNSLDADPKYTGGKNNKGYTYDAEKNGDDIYDEFHTISLYWDDKCMKFAMDGITWCDYEYKDNLSVSVNCLLQYFLISCGMGSPSYGTVYDPAVHEVSYESLYDSIKIYQIDNGSSQMIFANGLNGTQTGKRTVVYPNAASGLVY